MLALHLGSIFFLILLVQGSPLKNEESFQLHVVHVNDFHARYEETNDLGGRCKDKNKCIGGFSRQFEQITNLRKQDPNLLLLNGGDNFQGTLWYTVFKWNVTQYFMNKLNFDAMVLGNHEWDDGVQGVIPYMKAINAPIVVSNIDDSLEPDFQNLYKKSIIIERDGKKIGIVGVTAFNTPDMSNTGKLKFLNESTSVNAEAERLVKEENVFTVIVLSHCGYESDKIIAKNAVSKISLVVGAHSHSFLYTGEPVPGPDKVVGPYPTVIPKNDGEKVLVVQASALSKYVGNLSINFKENGEVQDWQGAPIFLATDSPKSDHIDQELQPWKEKIDQYGNKVLGSALVDLDGSTCYSKECTLGNMLTDAFVYSYVDRAEEGAWTYGAIAIINAGGVRTSIAKGNITYSDILTTIPFGDTIDVSDLQGKYIKEILEFMVTVDCQDGLSYVDTRLIQVSGIKYTVDLNERDGQKIKDIKIRCRKCTVPKYEPLNENETYRIITQKFLTDGGDGLDILTKHLKNTIEGPIDVDVLTKFLAHNSPVYEEEDRITVVPAKKKLWVRNCPKIKE